jgi:hypothetical protein
MSILNFFHVHNSDVTTSVANNCNWKTIEYPDSRIYICGRLELTKCVTHDIFCQVCFEDTPVKDDDENLWIEEEQVERRLKKLYKSNEFHSL